MLSFIVVRVRLTRKLANVMDGVDVTNYEPGDLIDLPERKARLLVAEGWAIADLRIAGPARVLAFRRATDPGHSRDHDEVVSEAS